MFRYLFLPIFVLFTSALVAQGVLPDIKAILERNKPTLGLSPADLAGISEVSNIPGIIAANALERLFCTPKELFHQEV